MCHSRRLITSDAYDQSCSVRSCDAPQCIGIQIAQTRVNSHCGAIDTENIPQIAMIFAGRDQGAQHAAQGQWCHPHPLGEIAPHPRLVNQRLADVEHHASDLRQEL